jgi:hypothetical protein
MSMTRRQFVGSCAAAVWSRDRPAWPVEASPGCVVLDLGEHCGLRESVVGYRFALASLSGVQRSPCLIVPAAVEIPPLAIRAIVTRLKAGGRVILESAAGFGLEREASAQRAVLRDQLQIHVNSPVRLWPRHVPYVDYTWPYAAKLRDFSRVVPLERQGKTAEIIAWADGKPVALKRRSGRGTLIFLGSPLGPALWAGDTAARRWLLDALVSLEQG